MSDIVDRLRNNPGYIIQGYAWINAEWIRDAADEIERLKGLLAANDWARNIQADEIERLRTEVMAWYLAYMEAREKGTILK